MKDPYSRPLDDCGLSVFYELALGLSFANALIEPGQDRFSGLTFPIVFLYNIFQALLVISVRPWGLP